MKRNREVIGSNDWGEWSSDGDSGKSRGIWGVWCSEK